MRRFLIGRGGGLQTRARVRVQDGACQTRGACAQSGGSCGQLRHGFIGGARFSGLGRGERGYALACQKGRPRLRVVNGYNAVVQIRRRGAAKQAGADHAKAGPAQRRFRGHAFCSQPRRRARIAKDGRFRTSGKSEGRNKGGGAHKVVFRGGSIRFDHILRRPKAQWIRAGKIGPARDFATKLAGICF